MLILETFAVVRPPRNSIRFENRGLILWAAIPNIVAFARVQKTTLEQRLHIVGRQIRQEGCSHPTSLVSMPALARKSVSVDQCEPLREPRPPVSFESDAVPVVLQTSQQ